MFSPIIRSTWLYLQYLVILFLISFTCFGRCFAHHQEHLTVYLVILFLVSFTCFGRCFRPSPGALDCISGNIIPSQLYMFRTMFSPIIRSTWLYLQYLVILFLVSFTFFGRCFAHHQEHLTVFTVSGNIIPSQLYVFRAMFSPIIRSTLLYLQYLVILFLVSSTCSGRCFRPSSGALYCIYSIW